MMKKIWNFSAGPSMLPHEVLQQAQAELLNWQDLGMSVMEISHRSSAFEALAASAKQDLRDLLNLPETFEIIFTTGGAQGQFALVPMNLLNQSDQADYLITGCWSEKAFHEASRFAKINCVADGKALNYQKIPDASTWKMSKQARYFHYVSNETVNGLQFQHTPNVSIPLIADMSSDFLSKPLDFSPYDLIYAGAQKNIGAAGLTVLLIRRSLLSGASKRVPAIFQYQQLAKFNSMPNTPPTYIWYLSSLVFKWLKREGGLAIIAQRNQHKAKLLYDFIDQSTLYINSVTPAARSLMNVVFDLRQQELLTEFLSAATHHGLIGLKGHKLRGGLRASIYNAMPEEGVLALIDFMKTFEKNTTLR